MRLGRYVLTQWFKNILIVTFNNGKIPFGSMCALSGLDLMFWFLTNGLAVAPLTPLLEQVGKTVLFECHRKASGSEDIWRLLCSHVTHK